MEDDEEDGEEAEEAEDGAPEPEANTDTAGVMDGDEDSACSATPGIEDEEGGEDDDKDKGDDDDEEEEEEEEVDEEGAEEEAVAPVRLMVMRGSACVTCSSEK